MLLGLGLSPLTSTYNPQVPITSAGTIDSESARLGHAVQYPVGLVDTGMNRVIEFAKFWP